MTANIDSQSEMSQGELLRLIDDLETKLRVANTEKNRYYMCIKELITGFGLKSDKIEQWYLKHAEPFEFKNIGIQCSGAVAKCKPKNFKPFKAVCKSLGVTITKEMVVEIKKEYATLKTPYDKIGWKHRISPATVRRMIFGEYDERFGL